MENTILLQAKPKRNYRYVFYLYLFAMLVGLFLRNALEISFPVQIFLFLTVIPLIFGDKNDILAVAATCIPFSAGFQYKNALFLCFIAYIIKKRGIIKLNTAILPILLMFFWETFHFVIGNFSINEHLRNFAELIFLAVVLCMDLDDVNYKKIFRGLSIATVGVCIIVFYMQLSGHDFILHDVLDQSHMEYRFGMGHEDKVLFGLNFNPNSLGYICNTSIFVILILITHKGVNILDLLLLVASVVFGFMTLSRSYVICLGFIVVYFSFVSGRTFKKKVLNLFSLAIVAGIVGWIGYNIFPEVFENLLERFLESDILNGRDTLFTFYHTHIFSSLKHLLFGIGLQDIFTKIFEMYGRHVNVPHNGFQELLVVWGIPGLIFFFWLILAMIMHSKKKGRSRTAITYGPLFLLLLSAMAGQLVRSGVVLLSMSVCYLALCIPKKIIKKHEKYTVQPPPEKTLSEELEFYEET